jgi:hypothetical protein
VIGGQAVPSLFPGMDPYLEGSLWMSVHTPLAVEIVRQLIPKLRPRYMALTTRRYVLDIPEEPDVSVEGIYPDVSVVRSDAEETRAQAPDASPPIVQMTTLMPEAIPETSVEIREVRSRQLVAVIEILSPTNKKGDGREEYLAKRNKILRSTVHLMEIDLLRKGRGVPMKEPMPQAPYFVFLSRADRRPATDVWPIALNQPLPTVPVPPLTGDHDASLDLQDALTNVYESCGLDMAVDYDQPPEVPLPPKAASWAMERIQARLQ